MFKKICLLLLLPVAGYSQTLNVSVEPASSGNGYDTFRLGSENITFSGNAIRFGNTGAEFGSYLAYGISPDYSTMAVLQHTAEGARAFLLDTGGDTLTSYKTISLDYDDPSLAVYPLNSGSALVRNNIANFTYYDPAGSVGTGGSGSSRSKQGESISEVAMDPNSKTILIYTPKIKQQNGIGSQAQVLREDRSLQSIFYSNDRQIRFGGVSPDGQFVLLITTGSGAGDRVSIMDRYGNELNSITSDEELEAARLTGELQHLIAYSSRRALVYETMTGERIGSTSFRSPVIVARYFPDDATIVALTGSRVGNSDVVKELEFHAIHLTRREIAREELRGAIGVSSGITLDIERLGSGSYRLVGASKTVNLQASF